MGDLKFNSVLFHFGIILLTYWLPTEVTTTCSDGTNYLYSSDGWITCSLNGVSYSNSINASWIVHSNGVKQIKFSRLKLHQCCTLISMYENTTSPSESYERFRIDSSELIASEFWLIAPFVVRFEMRIFMGSTEFQLNYASRSEAISAATEVINQKSGARRSLPYHGYYRAAYRKAWSIQVPRNYQVTIGFNYFVTEKCCDKLRIYSGNLSENQSLALLSVSGDRNRSLPMYRFNHSVILLFESSRYGGSHGFEFVFNVTTLGTIVSLNSNTGKISYPVDGSTTTSYSYSENIDVIWIIGLKLNLKLQFTELKTRSCCSTIQIYEKTSFLNSDKERFRLNSSDAVQSELWLSGPVLIRFFSNDSSFTDQRFQLNYETRTESLLGATEFIKQQSGIRVSHPTFYSGGFLLAQYRKIFCFSVPHGFLLSVKLNIRNPLIIRMFHRFDPLRVIEVHNGSTPSVDYKSLYSFHPLNSYLELYFKHSISIDVKNFNYYENAIDFGFQLEFYVTKMGERRIIEAFVHDWPGRILQDSFVSLLASPASEVSTVSCSFQPACDSRVINWTLNNADNNEWHFIDAKTIDLAGICIGSATCSASWRFGLPSVSQVHLDLLHADPESLEIELLELSHWSQTGVIKFRAVSKTACSSVRHRCELRTTMNNSSITGLLIKRDVTRPSGPLCLSAVTSLFAIAVAEPSDIVGSVIECRLFNGSLVLQKLPNMPTSTGSSDGRLARLWKRPLLLASSSIAAFAIVALVLVTIVLLVKTSNKRAVSLSPQTQNRTKAPEIKLKATCNAYLGESAGRSENDATGIYVA